MPDFENDEIRDSSFPVEFNDETEALDMYGVWVKSGPRDVSSLDEEEQSASESRVEPELPVFSDVPDISEFDELPDMEDFDDDGMEAETVTMDAVSSDDVSDTSFELPDFGVFSDGESADTLDNGEESTESSGIATERDDFEFGDISFEDSDMDEMESLDESVEDIAVDEATPEEVLTEEPSLSDYGILSEDDTLSDISLDISEETPAEPVSLQESAEEETAGSVPDEQFSIDMESDSPDTLESYEENAAPEAGMSGNDTGLMADGVPEPDIADFDDVLDGFDDEDTDEVSGEEVLAEELEIAVDPDAVTPGISANMDEPPLSGSDEEHDTLSAESFAEFDGQSAEESADLPEEMIEEFEEETESDTIEASSGATDESSMDSLADLDPDLANFSMEDFAGIADMINSEQSSAKPVGETLPEEDDFSSLLDDINSGAAPSDSSGASGFDDLDLDDFINEINDSGGSTEKEKEKLFSDVEPVDIDLEFDEEFIENSEKIRAAGSLISEAEFENSEFGVEFVDETGSGDEEDAFDAFDSDEFFAADEKTTAAVAASKKEDDNLEIASEFDDLLASLDSARPTTPGVSGESENKEEQEFNLLVTEEDGLEAVSNASPEMNENDEFDVPLFSTSPEADSGDAPTVVEAESATGEELSTETEDLEPASVDLSSFEEYSPENEELSPEDDDFAGMEELLPDESPVFDIAAIEEDTTESVNSPHEAEPDDTSYEFSILDSDDDTLEIVEKDNLEISEDSVYNEEQSGILDSDNEDISIDFDDVSAFEESLHEPVVDTGETDVTSNDKSTELLMLIAEELSSIKRELSTLNSELSTTMKSVPRGEESSSEAFASESTDNTGFFSDDDTDETIALTGDELNNILITADFTEEKTEEPETEDFIDSVESDIGDFSVEEADQSGEDVTADFNPVEETGQFDEITFDDADTTGEPEDLDIPEVLTEDEMFGSNEIVDTVEVSYVNKVDDDVSYLEGGETVEPDLENVAIEESEIETLDFNDENLEEPELTEFNIDFSAMEDSISSAADAAEESTLAETNQSLVEEIQEFEVGEAEESDSGTLLAEEEPESVVDGSDIEVPVLDQADKTAVEEKSGVTDIDTGVAALPVELKDEIKSVLSYMDQLLESLPEEKIEEFARSEHFEVYKKLFEELGIT